MKRKISLMLVLGIVGVLVVSFIIDSRTSATTMESVDVQVYQQGCIGTATSCDSYDNENGCTGQAGCTWEGETGYGSYCVGTATSCHSYNLSEYDCLSQNGCSWTGYETIGYIEIPIVVDIMDDLVDDWRTEDVNWDYIWDTEDLMMYAYYLSGAIWSDSDIGYALDVLDNIPANIIYYDGFDEYNLGIGSLHSGVINMSFEINEQEQFITSVFDNVTMDAPAGRGVFLISYTFSGGTISYDATTDSILYSFIPRPDEF